MTYDALEMRCPRLGGPATFAYCRLHADPSGPCPRILNCWWQRFDVVAYLRPRLAPEAWEGLCRPRQDSKMASLVDLIGAAQKAVGRE